MKYKANSTPILLTALAAGLSGFVLRLVLYRVGFDDRGLLPRLHPLHLSCVLLVAVSAAAGIFFLKVPRVGYRPARFLNRWGRTILAPVIAVCLLLHSWSLLSAGLQPASSPSAYGILSWARMALALGAAAASLGILWLSIRNSLINLALHSILCLFFTLDMLCRYQHWSGNPQLPDYLLQIFACICFSLCSYSRMAIFGQIQRPRLHGISSYLSMVLGLICTAGPESPLFYLAGACWAAAGLWLPNPGSAPFRNNRQEESQ